MNIAASDFGAIADAVYLQHPGESLADALGHVGDQLAHQPMHRALALRIARTLHLEMRVIHLDRKARRDTHLELALGTLELERFARKLRLHAFFQGDRQSAYPRHRPFPSTRPSEALRRRDSFAAPHGPSSPQAALSRPARPS